MANANTPDESVERTEVMPRPGKVGGERLPRSINSPMKGREERYLNRPHSTNITGQRVPKDEGMRKGGEAKGKKVRASRGMGDMAPSKMPSKKAKGGKLNIKKAIKKPGALHAQLGVPKGEKIPAGKIAAAAKKPGNLGQRARFAEVLSGVRKKK